MADEAVRVLLIAPVVRVLVGVLGDDGADGKSAYQLWLDQGNTGTLEDYLASLEGTDGESGGPGKSAYQLWLDAGHSGTQQDFLDQIVNIDQFARIMAATAPLTPPVSTAPKLWLDNGFVRMVQDELGSSAPYQYLTHRQWRYALASQGKLETALTLLPLGDVNDSTTIQWESRSRIVPHDDLWSATQSALGYNNTQMSGLADLAANSPA